jgi:hypothetical protein
MTASHVASTAMAGRDLSVRRLAVVDVQDLAGDEARALLLEDTVGDLARPSKGVHRGWARTR